MRLGIVSGGTGWHVQDLLRAAGDLGIVATVIDFRTLTHTLPRGRFDADALLVRTMPAGSLEQIVFRMNRLHMADVPVFNTPRVLETCIDKYLTTAMLAQAGQPVRVPKTWVGESAEAAMAAFADLGGDVVLKPLFGSEGRGMVRLTDAEVAWRAFRAVQQTGGVLYVQQFLRHPGWDVRAFVLRYGVLAAIKRTARDDWRTNVAQGGIAEPFDIPMELRNIAVTAAMKVGADIAGVDLIQDHRGKWFVLEVNAVPGWKALSATCGIDVASEILAFVRDQCE